MAENIDRETYSAARVRALESLLIEKGVKVSSGRAGGFSIWEPLKAA